MKTFEYLTILLSIMLGFCLTQMATNFVWVIHHFNESNLYAPTILWNAAALIALFGHWVNFFKAASINTWTTFQLTIVGVAPLIFYVPAQLLVQAPMVDGRLDLEVIFDANKLLIYVCVILFILCTIAHHYFIYKSRSMYVYVYYVVAIVLVALVMIFNSKSLDLILAIGIVISELMNHYVSNPLKLNTNEEKVNKHE